MKRYLILAFVLFVLAADVKASSLFGRVIEVNSGDVITIINLNRPVRVRLLGVDAPELDQAFGDVARKHLSDLVYDKSVLVEYSGIGGDKSVMGRVLLNDADIGAQMIRDGAAWFDPSNQSRLNQTDREVYQASEMAARNEKRGLWEAGDAVAPWEHAKAKALKQIPHASLNEIVPEVKPRPDRPTPELTNLTLMFAGLSSKGSPAEADNYDSTWARDSRRRNWTQLRPDGEDFSALVPEEGQRKTYAVSDEYQGFDMRTYMARDGWAFYSVIWLSGLTYGETDQDAIAASLHDYLKGSAQGYERGSGRTDFSCKPRGQRNVSVSGYTATEFDLATCTTPIRIRIFTKVVEDRRRVYIAAAIFGEGDENIDRFFSSFKVGSSQTKARP